jgi:Fic family protein
MTTPRRATPEEQIESRVLGEFLEMPGLRLSFEQARRLWGLDEATCARVLDALVARGFLTRDAKGAYGRPTDQWPMASLRMARANIARQRKADSH